ncbi:UPF0280 family protein [Desulfovibrio sp. OttesenSCG-928-F07]|nr:UPF0280 family protein [Desulfovibrio sp. OttesenSCG-928-F07]
MKIPYSIRSYRAQSPNAAEQSFQVVLEESDLWVTCLKSAPADIAKQMLNHLSALRSTIKAWANLNPEFATSLTPLPCNGNEPEIIQQMLQAAQLMQVGPMAAVAGTVAEAICRKFLPYTSEIIVENGGDVFICSAKDRNIGLLPDPATKSYIGVKLKKELFPVSVCSSSSTIGHSLSFGKGELVTVIAKSAAIADAAATSYCNKLQNKNDIELIINLAQKDPHILGVFAQIGDQIGLWGNIELIVL